MLRRRPSPAPLVALLTAACTGAPPPASPNVLLVTLDTTRADRLGAYGRPGAHTPRIDALARQGALFRRAYSSAPLTLPAHASLLTGISPLRHGVRDNFGFSLPAELGTLAERFGAAGYATAAVVGAAVLDRGSGVERGFVRYDDLSSGSGPGAPVERRADAVVERALAISRGLGGGPQFLWVHLYDAHLPYDAPAVARGLHPDDAYAAELSWLDVQLGRLLDGLAGEWIVALTADHGEGLGDHGEPDHGVFVYDSTLHVPLLLRAPGLAPRAIDALVRDVDLAPTLLDLARLPPPPGLDGRSLRPLLEGQGDAERVAYAESHYARLHYGWSPLRVLRDGRHKLIEAPRPELYDTLQDPGERRDLAGASRAALDAMRARLAELERRVAAPTAAAALTPAAERLRALGYAGSQLTLPEGETLPDPKTKLEALGHLFRATSEGLTLIESGRLDEAIALFDRALRAEPRYLDGYVLKGEALYRLGRFGEAARAFERALALGPSAEAHYDVARARSANGELERAIEELTAGRALAPGDARFDAAEARIREARASANRLR